MRARHGPVEGIVRIIFTYRIAGNFRAVQNFAFFADRSRSAKIKTTKNFVMRMRKGEGGSTLRTAGTGLKGLFTATLLLISKPTDNLLDPKGPL